MKLSREVSAFAIVLFSATAVLAQYGNETRFTINSGRNGVAVCDDVNSGGQAGARLESCQDIGTGQNHGCNNVYNGCQAWEGPGNGGDAACLAVCKSAYVPQQYGFRVRYYNQEVTRCDGPGGRPGARAISCVDVAHGKNHGCTLEYEGCHAWEGNGNGGNAACDANCQ